MNFIPVYKSFFRTRRDKRIEVELRGNTGQERLLTLARYWYTSTRSTDYRPPTLLVLLARRTSHRA